MKSATHKLATTSGERHLDWMQFEQRIQRGVPIQELFPGTPKTALFIDEGGSRVGLRIHEDLKDLPSSPLSEIAIIRSFLKKHPLVELYTRDETLFRPFFDFACELADSVQVSGNPCGVAINDLLKRWEKLLQRELLMSDEKQVGLLGELLFLEWVAKATDWKRAAGYWNGPKSEEHDFVLPETDVEVKTTCKEERVHVIASLSQLEQKKIRVLHLVSIQLTCGSRGSGFSLRDKVESAKKAAKAAGVDVLKVLEERLNQYGWRDKHARQYVNPYLLRNEILVIPVDAAFPRFTPAVVKSVLKKQKWDRVGRVTYEIRVDGLGSPLDSKEAQRALKGRKRGRV